MSHLFTLEGRSRGQAWVDVGLNLSFSTFCCADTLRTICIVYFVHCLPCVCPDTAGRPAVSSPSIPSRELAQLARTCAVYSSYQCIRRFIVVFFFTLGRNERRWRDGCTKDANSTFTRRPLVLPEKVPAYVHPRTVQPANPGFLLSFSLLTVISMYICYIITTTDAQYRPAFKFGFWGVAPESDANENSFAPPPPSPRPPFLAKLSAYA